MNTMNNQAFSKIWIMVILVAIIGGGVLIWQYSEIQNNDNNENKINEEMPEDETANWKTYRSEEYGFEIKYPKDWLIEEQKGSENNLLYSLFYLDTEKEDGIYPIQIYFWENPEQIPIKQWIEKKSGRFISGINEISEITIDDYQGVKLIESGKVRLPKSGLTKGWFDKESIYISRGTLIYNLTTTVNHKYFNQMLSTFKFIESGDETMNWETYKNEEYEFEIKYPNSFRATEELNIGGSYRPDANRIVFSSPEAGMQISIEPWTKFGEGLVSLEDWIKRKKKDQRDNPFISEISEENIILDNNPATEMSIIYPAETPMYGEGELIIIFTQKGTRMYDIRGWISSEERDIGLLIFNQMLSSFKFAENTLEDEKPYIKILSPNGGEQWVVGETHNIVWDSSGVEKVSIEITGSGHGKILGIVDADDKKFAWTIPAFYSFSADSTNEKPRLKISISKFSGQSDISDVSDDYFSVIKK